MTWLLASIQALPAARLWAATKFPYLATGVFGAQVIAERGSGTVSVDENWRMRADPELTAGWTPAQLGSVLIHHVCHLLRTHGERAQDAGVRPDEAGDWIRAADAEINDDLVPAGLDLPGRPVLPRDLRAEDGLLAEQYFDGIRRAARAPGGAGAGTGDRSASPGTPEAAGPWLDCGSGADGMPRAGQGSGGLPRWQADLLRRQVAQDVIAHGKQAGTVPAGLLRWAEEILAPKVNWRAVLAAELRRAVAEVSGAVDYSYRRPSRRSAVAGPVVLPALRRPVPEVAVVCDTSGSMTADLLAMVLAEVEGLLRALGLARQVRVLACDTAVAAAQRVSSARQVQLVGGGGTDMGAGIAAAAALRPRPAVTVVLTDGYTPWPSLPPKGMRVVVGLLGAQAPEAPPWGRSVRVDPAEWPCRSYGWLSGPVCLVAARGDLLSGDGHQAKTADTDADRDRAHVRFRRDGRGQLHPAGRRLHQRHDRQHRAGRAWPWPRGRWSWPATPRSRSPVTSQGWPAAPGSRYGFQASAAARRRRGPGQRAARARQLGAVHRAHPAGRAHRRLGDHRRQPGRVGAVLPARGRGGGHGRAGLRGQRDGTDQCIDHVPHRHPDRAGQLAGQPGPGHAARPAEVRRADRAGGRRRAVRAAGRDRGGRRPGAAAGRADHHPGAGFGAAAGRPVASGAKRGGGMSLGGGSMPA